MDQVEYDSIYKWLLEVDKDAVGQHVGTIDSRTKAIRSDTKQGHDDAHQSIDTAMGSHGQKIATSQKRRHSAVETLKTLPKALDLEQPTAPSTTSRDRPMQNTSKKRKDGYERRPRHKTREERYEYKAGRSSRKGKRKSNKSRRKDALNENFHASNVTRHRLTLYSNPNLGIFQKGKTSSPVRPGELPDLAFSEMNFLSKRPRLSYEGTPACDRSNSKKEEMQQEQLALQKHVSQYFLNTSCKQRTVSPAPIEGDNELFSPRQDCTSEARESVNAPKSATPYTWSESARKESEIDSSFEDYVNSLLLAGSNLRNTSEQSAEAKQDKKYWDLEELKRLLERRKRAWDFNSDNPFATGNSTSRVRKNQSPPDRREMEVTSFQHATASCDMEEVTESPPDSFYEVRNCKGNANSREDLLPFIPSFGDANLNVYDQPHEHPTPPEKLVSTQIRSYDFENPRFDFFPGTLQTWGSRSQSTRSNNPIRQKGPHTEMEFRRSVRGPGIESSNMLRFGYSDTAGLKFEDNEELFIQTLDAAYNAIVHSEGPCGALDNAAVDVSTLEGSDKVPMAFQESRISCLPNLISQSSMLRPAANSEERFQDELSSRFLPSNLYTPSTENPHLDWNRPLDHAQQTPKSTEFQAPPDGFYAINSSLLGQRQPEANTHPRMVGLSLIPLEEPPGFWRQNKLY